MYAYMYFLPKSIKKSTKAGTHILYVPSYVVM